MRLGVVLCLSQLTNKQLHPTKADVYTKAEVHQLVNNRDEAIMKKVSEQYMTKKAARWLSFGKA